MHSRSWGAASPARIDSACDMSALDGAKNLGAAPPSDQPDGALVTAALDGASPLSLRGSQPSSEAPSTAAPASADSAPASAIVRIGQCVIA